MWFWRNLGWETLFPVGRIKYRWICNSFDFWDKNYFDSPCHAKGNLNASDVVWGGRPFLIFSLCYKVKVILKRDGVGYFIIINRKRGGVGWFTSLRSFRLARDPLPLPFRSVCTAIGSYERFRGLRRSSTRVSKCTLLYRRSLVKCLRFLLSFLCPAERISVALLVIVYYTSRNIRNVFDGIMPVVCFNTGRN
jgi:hypothetical protein